MDMVCRKQVCKYNNCNRCKLKDIDVDKNSFCLQMDKDSQKEVQNISEDMFTKPIKVAPYVHSMNMNIKCKADCIHNVDGECFSNGVIFNSIKSNAECISFVKK